METGKRGLIQLGGVGVGTLIIGAYNGCEHARNDGD